MSTKKQKGFTLIELLVVVAIIGLLASIVLASLTTARQKGRDARRLADLKEIQSALELYYSDHNVYPTSASQATAATALSALVSGGYMSVVADDPLGGSYHYVYIAPAATVTSKYCLGSILESTAPQGISTACTNGLTLTGVNVTVNP